MRGVGMILIPFLITKGMSPDIPIDCTNDKKFTKQVTKQIY